MPPVSPSSPRRIELPGLSLELTQSLDHADHPLAALRIEGHEPLLSVELWLDPGSLRRLGDFLREEADRLESSFAGA